MKMLIVLISIFGVQAMQGQSPGGVGTGLEMWLDAGQGGAAWTDQSGNVTLTTVGTPITVANAINGNNAVEFSGSSQYYNLDSNLGFDGVAQDHAIYVVLEPDNTTTFRSIIGGQNGGFGSIQYLLQTGGSIYLDQDGTGTTANSNPGLPVNSPTLVSTTFQQSTVNTANVNVEYFFNGTAAGGNTNWPLTAAASPMNVHRLGARETTGAVDFFDGRIAEVIIYSQNTVAERAQIESYLSIKYGILKDGDYLNGTGATVFTPTAPYINSVAGIALDTGAELDQQTSTPPGGIVTMSDALTDGSYLFWAADAGTLTYGALGAGAPLNYQRLNRGWRTTELAVDANNTTVSVDAADLPAFPAGSDGNLYLLQGADLATATPVLMTLSAGTYSATGRDFVNGEFFSFASFTMPPCPPVDSPMATPTTGQEASSFDVSWTLPTPNIEMGDRFIVKIYPASTTITEADVIADMPAPEAGAATNGVNPTNPETVTSLTVDGLRPGIEYQIWVQTDCGSTGANTGGAAIQVPGTFTTENYEFEIVADGMTTNDESVQPTASVNITNGQNNTGAAVTVPLTFTDVSTTAGDDYVVTASVDIGNGTNTQSFTVSVTNDMVVEADEDFTIAVTDADGAGPGTAASAAITYTITDNDMAMVTIENVSGNEDDGDLTFTATLDNAVDGGFTVDVNTADGTATTADMDYTAIVSETLTFAGTAGETQ
ncbi:hypothetical protein EAX61_02025, partial [Dokdonia sinensis]